MNTKANSYDLQSKWNRLGKGIAKIVVILLCLSLFCAFLPTIAWAEEAEQTESAETSDIVQEPLAPEAGRATIIENVVTEPGETQPSGQEKETNQLEDLLEPGEEDSSLTFTNEYPAVVQTEVYDNTGVRQENLLPEGSTAGSGLPTSDLYEVKPDGVPISNDIVRKDTGETVTPPEEVQEELKDTPFGALQKNDNGTPNDSTDDTYVRSRETVSDNAINQAVAKALESATQDSKYITIAVTAGVYNGDIQVNATGENLADGFKLYILAEDSYEKPEDGEIIDKSTVGEQSQGDALVNGNIYVNAAKNFEIIMAGLYLSMNSVVEARDKASVTIHGTQKDDTVTFTQSGSGDTKIRTGDGNDTITGTHRGAGDVTVESGDGNDQVSLRLEGTYSDKAEQETAIRVSTGAGSDDVSVSGEKASGSGARMEMNLGGGADNVDINLSTANAAKAISLYGQDGYDILKLSGEIYADGAKSVSERDYAGGDKDYTIQISNNAKRPIEILAYGFDALADGITNKPQQEITKEQVQGGTITVSDSFTDYVLTEDALELVQTGTLTMQATGDQKIYFSKLVISGEELSLGEINLTGLDLEIRGKQIKLNKNITADNISVHASDTDEHGESGITGSISSSDLDQSLAGVKLDFWNFDFSTEALVEVAKDAVLTAVGSILLTASSIQTKPIFGVDVGSLVDVQFPLAVKFGRADISINGTLNAGGQVSAQASTDIRVAANNEIFKRFRLPLSVMIVNAEANTNLASGGSITSGSDTDLVSKVNVSTSSIATIGIIPLSLAFSFVNVNAVSQAAGTINAGGDINITAEAVSNVTTISQEDAPKEQTNVEIGTGNAGTVVIPPQSTSGNSFGGFFAVAIVLQDSQALVLEGAKLTAGGDVNVTSTSTEKATTRAQASMKSADGQQQAMSLNSVTGILTGLLNMIKNNPNTAVLGNVGVAKLTNLMGQGVNKIKGGELKVNVETTENGTVTAPMKANKGDTVTVRAVPDSGYTINTAVIGYTDQATGTYKTVVVVPEYGTGRPTTTDFTFVMPDVSVKLVVLFRKLNAGETALTLGTGAIDSRSGIQGAVESANSGATDPFVAPTYPTQAGTDAFSVTTAPVEQISGVTPGTVTTNTGFAKNGQKVLVEIHPADGYELDKLTIEKTLGTGASQRVLTEEIGADDNGRYIFVMPAGAAKVKATFRAKTSTPGQSSSDMGTTGSATKNQGQLVGSVAVAFVTNDNKADIRAGTGFVNAESGKVNVKAEATTQSISLADASPIDRDPKSTTVVNVNDGQANIQDQVTAEKSNKYGDNASNPDFTVVYTQMKNGSSADEAYANANAGTSQPQKITFKLNARDGYYISKVWFTYVTTVGTEVTTEQVSGNKELYTYSSGAKKTTGEFGLLNTTAPTSPAEGTFYGTEPFAFKKVYIYAEFLPLLYSIEKETPAGTTGKPQNQYSYQISGVSGTTPEGLAQARKDSVVVVHSLKLGTLNVSGNYDYNKELNNNDLRMVVYKKGDPNTKLEVTPNSTGGFTFTMPSYDVVLQFVAKTVKLEILDANSGTAGTEPTKSALSLGQFQVTEDAQGGKVYTAKLSGTADSRDKIVLNVSQTAYDNGKKLVITLEGYGNETTGQQTISKVLDIGTIEVVNDGNGLYSFVMPDLNNNSFPVQGEAGKNLPLAGLRIKYSFGADKEYKMSAQATTRPRVGDTGTVTTPTTPSTPSTKPYVSETTGGIIQVAPAIDKGENIYVTVNPYSGYRLVSNSLKITFTFQDGTKQTTVLGLDSNGVYKFALTENLPKELAAYDQTTGTYPIVISGEFASDAGGIRTSDRKTFSAGVGVDVAITNHTNQASITSGQVTAEHLAVTAATPETIQSSASSLAGYSAGDFGVAGAVTVHVVSTKTYAQVAKDAKLTVGTGDVSIQSESKTAFTTEAEGSNANGAAGSTIGVGAGIAVAVIGVDSVAEICDGAQINQKENISLNDLTIQAESTNKETMTAKAGSAGGFSATPVVALTISAVTNEALLGKTGGAEVLKALNGSVEAKSYIDRQLAANASAAGGSVGLGGSFAITVLNDTTRAESRKSFKGSSLKVSRDGPICAPPPVPAPTVRRLRTLQLPVPAAPVPEERAPAVRGQARDQAARGQDRGHPQHPVHLTHKPTGPLAALPIWPTPATGA